jgi:hypothetical protein
MSVPNRKTQITGYMEYLNATEERNKQIKELLISDVRKLDPTKDCCVVLRTPKGFPSYMFPKMQLILAEIENIWDCKAMMLPDDEDISCMSKESALKLLDKLKEHIEKAE